MIASIIPLQYFIKKENTFFINFFVLNLVDEGTDEDKLYYKTIGRTLKLSPIYQEPMFASGVIDEDFPSLRLCL